MGQRYIQAFGIHYANELKSIHKSRKALQPVYEAFSNAWEAIVELMTSANLMHGKIHVSFFYDKSLSNDPKECSLAKIEVSDNGVGMNEANFSRVCTLRDSSKSDKNKGTGRVQYLHFFEMTTFDSVYKSRNGNEHIILSLSKSQAFLTNNAILRVDQEAEPSSLQCGTTISMRGLMDSKSDSRYYSEVSIEDIKKELIIHFLSLLCENRSRLPKIELTRIEGDDIVDSIQIQESDIPVPDKDQEISVPLSRLDGNRVIDSVSQEKFTLTSFIQPAEILDGNSIYFVSKGALAQECSVDSLEKGDSIDGNRYLFLLRGAYFDSVDDDSRGNLHLIKESDFKRQNENSLFPEECLLVDRIKEETNSVINTIYPCFSEKHNAAIKNLDELRDMFLIDEEAISSMKRKLKTSSSDESILKTVYQVEMESVAKNDAKIKRQYELLKELSPAQKDYQDKLAEQVESFVKLVPLQNRTNLTKYLARRKLVLEVFDMILAKELDSLKDGGRINENLLHNLIFQQHSIDTSCSDLWLIDDQYIYFDGCSEKEFNQLRLGDDLLLKPDDELSEEQLSYKTRNGRKDTGLRRPDVLLYPCEGKCIIIEFKAPDVPVSEHLSQINRYAMMIRNLSSDKFNILSFYGYLIGEEVNYYDIQENDTNFKFAPTLNYIFRPSYEVTGKFGRENGYLYTEVIKYSDILSRAKARNRVFLEKLEGK